MRLFITLLTLLAWHVTCDAAVQVLDRHEPVSGHELLENAPTASQVLEPFWQQQFSPVHQGRRLPADQGAWIRMHVRQPGSEPAIWWLDPWPMTLTHLQAYRQQGDGLLPIGSQTIRSPLALMLPPGDSILYVQLHSPLPQAIALQWRPDDSASHRILLRRSIASAALGALSLMVLVSLGFMVLYRDRVYGVLSAMIGGYAIWFWMSWFGSGIAQLPLAIHGIYLCAVCTPILVWTLKHRLPLYAGINLLWILLGVAGCLSVWLLPPTIATQWAIAGWSIALLGSAAWGVRLGLMGTLGALGVAIPLGFPIIIILSLLLSSDNNLLSLMAPSYILLGSVMVGNIATLVGLIRRTKHRWLDYEARQRMLDTVETVTRSRGDILGRISHEIRTPMSGILGMSELLQETPLNPQQQEYVATIQDSGHSLLNLIGEVLDDSTLVMEGGIANAVPFDPESLVLEVINGFRSLANHRHIELVCDMDEHTPSVLIGDPIRLRQVLLHTLGHAIRHSSGDEVTIRATCDVANQKAALHFDVHYRDPEAGLQHGNNTKVDALKQTHAGLSVAQRLVSMMQGDFSIRSDASSGTTVSFELALPIERITRSDPQHTMPLENRRLLIVDDSDTVLNTLVHYTNGWGMSAETARTGSEALGKTRNRLAMGQPYDIILLDHDLPGMNGLELARRLQQIQEPAPAIILLTGLRHFPAQAEYQSAGISRLLSKPVTGNMLRQTLLEALAQPQLASGNMHTQQPIHVLLAEDNPVTARVIEAMLKKLGAQCTRVENGQQAVDACQTHTFDLVLMDCDMPVMDGYTATRTIREWEHACGNAPVKIYALTAHILDEYREQSRRAGMDGHLGKPVALPQLANVLEQCLHPH